MLKIQNNSRVFSPRYKDGMQDACSGDSGGPLVVFRGDNRAEVCDSQTFADRKREIQSELDSITSLFFQCLRN